MRIVRTLLVATLLACASAIPIQGFASELSLRHAIVTALGEEPPDLRYEVRRVDLNDDGAAEVVVWVPTLAMGGTSGYPLLVFARRGSNYWLVWFHEQAWTPLVVLRTKQRGWRDLGVTLGGGGDRMRLVRFRFNGSSYSGGPEAMRSQRPHGRWYFTRSRTDTTFGPLPGGAPN